MILFQESLVSRFYLLYPVLLVSLLQIKCQSCLYHILRASRVCSRTNDRCFKNVSPMAFFQGKKMDMISFYSLNYKAVNEIIPNFLKRILRDKRHEQTEFISTEHRNLNRSNTNLRQQTGSENDPDSLVATDTIIYISCF